MTLQFKNLHVGDTFDFVAPNSRTNSFFLRCIKISPRKYRDSSGTEHRIGRDLCRIYNILTAEDSMVAAHIAGRLYAAAPDADAKGAARAAAEHLHCGAFLAGYYGETRRIAARVQS